MLGQATDAAVSLRISTPDEILVALKINCLFFNRSVLPIMHLIGNKEFYNLFENDRDGLGGLLAAGLLVPQYALRSDDQPGKMTATLVARRMIESRTQSGVIENSLLEMSEFLDATRARQIFIEQDSLKIESRKNCIRSIEEIARSLAKDGSDFKLLHEIVGYCESSNYFSESDVWTIIDRSHDNSFKRLLQLSISSATLFSSSVLSNVQLSTSGEQTKHIDRLRPHLDVYGQGIEHHEFFDIEGDFDIGALTSLGLSEILLLRELGPIRNLRNELCRIRSGGNFSEIRLQYLVDDCSAVISDFSEESKVGKRNYKKTIDRELLRTRIRVGAAGSLAVAPMIEFFLVGAGGPLNFLMLAGGAYLAIDGVSFGTRPNRRAVFQSKLGYRPADGATKPHF